MKGLFLDYVDSREIIQVIVHIIVLVKSQSVITIR